MNKEVLKLIKIQEKTKIKVFHNELMIVHYLLTHGPAASMDILRETGRSVSAHNDDIKRLMQLGIIKYSVCSIDKRRRLYELTEDFKNAII